MALGIECCNSCPTTQTVNIPGAQGETGATGADGADGFVAPASGNPEGSVIGNPGQTYLNTDDDSFWIKKSGTATAYGWIELIAGAACILFMLFLMCSSADAQPIVRTYYTTNTTPTVANNITNTALVSITNNYTYISNAIVANTLTNATLTNASLTQVRWAATNDTATYSTIVGKQHTNGATGNIHLLSSTGLPWALMVSRGTTTNSYATNAPIGWTGVQYIVDALDATTNQFWYTNGILYITNRYSW